MAEKGADYIKRDGLVIGAVFLIRPSRITLSFICELISDYMRAFTVPVSQVSGCGECSFSSDMENNHNVQFAFVLYSISSSQLFAAITQLKTYQNEINSPYMPFHHECSGWFKKRPLEHSNQIMYIKRFL